MRFSLALLALASASSAAAATVTFDCTKVPNICSNDFYATKCLGFPTTLHRDSADATAHRNANACRSPNRCAGHDDQSNSCDEYPYASSAEGGKGAVTRCVPSHENSVQGGTLSSFYTRAGVAQGDAYNVAFSNAAGLEYNNGDCSNNGDELVRRRSIVPQQTVRHFLTSEGQTITMLEPVSQSGSLDSMVGQDIYLGQEDRFVKLVSTA